MSRGRAGDPTAWVPVGGAHRALVAPPGEPVTWRSAEHAVAAIVGTWRESVRAADAPLG